MRRNDTPIKPEFSWVYERQRLEGELALLESRIDHAIEQYLSGESGDIDHVGKERMAVESLSATIRAAMLDLPHGPVPTPQSWGALRKRVYSRDGGICQSCGIDVCWESFQCGHVIDRYIGGPDALENLVCMCLICNGNKPAHDTREDYDAWVAAGAGWRHIFRGVGNSS